jgi:hypothetical protein
VALPVVGGYDDAVRIDCSVVVFMTPSAPGRAAVERRELANSIERRYEIFEGSGQYLYMPREWMVQVVKHLRAAEQEKAEAVAQRDAWKDQAEDDQADTHRDRDLLQQAQAQRDEAVALLREASVEVWAANDCQPDRSIKALADRCSAWLDAYDAAHPEGR